MDPIAEQQPGAPGPRRSRVGRGVLATGAAVVALGVGAVGATAGSSSPAAVTDGSDAPAPSFVQETTPEAPADPAPRGDRPCPEEDGSGGGSEGSGSGSGAEAQTPDASDAALY
jgi:hypothetical protein